MSNSKGSGGVGFIDLLTILFIGLKLSGHIDWSWWLVLLPEIIEFTLLVIVSVAAEYTKEW